MKTKAQHFLLKVLVICENRVEIPEDAEKVPPSIHCVFHSHRGEAEILPSGVRILRDEVLGSEAVMRVEPSSVD